MDVPIFSTFLKIRRKRSQKKSSLKQDVLPPFPMKTIRIPIGMRFANPLLQQGFRIKFFLPNPIEILH